MTKISNQYSLTNILTADLANSRLGINNVSPAYSLDLTGTARVSGVSTFSSNVGIGTTSPLSGLGNGLTIDGASYAPLYFSNSGTQRGYFTGYSGGLIINASSGTLSLNNGGANVGIGTSSPAGISTYTTLDIRGATGGGIKMGVSASSTPFNLQQAGTDAYLNNVANGAMLLYTNDTERMRILANGNVAIGSSTDNGNKLQVTGAISASGNINGANIGGSSFSMSFGSSFNFGTGYLKSSTNGITVTTSTTTIYTSTNIGGVLSGNLVVVTGVRSGNGVNFVDLILYMNSGSISVISSQVFGSPPGRSYSVSNENLNLSMASGSYVVACVALIQGYTNP